MHVCMHVCFLSISFPLAKAPRISIWEAASKIPGLGFCNRSTNGFRDGRFWSASQSVNAASDPSLNCNWTANLQGICMDHLVIDKSLWIFSTKQGHKQQNKDIKHLADHVSSAVQMTSGGVKISRASLRLASASWWDIHFNYCFQISFQILSLFTLFSSNICLVLSDIGIYAVLYSHCLSQMWRWMLGKGILCLEAHDYTCMIRSSV